MLATQIEVSDGTLGIINVGIQFFKQTDISVSLDQSDQPLTLGVDYVWSASTTVTFLASPSVPGGLVPAGVEVIIRRDTKNDQMYNILDGGAPFSRLTLDENYKQLLYLTQEFSEGLGLDGLRNNLNMNGYGVVNVGPPVSNGDAVNKQYVDSENSHNIRTPETIIALPSAVTRANTLLAFDSNGNPTTALPVSGSATDLAIALANLTDTLKGASMVGYRGRTVTARLDDVVNGRDYGMRNLPGYDNRLSFQKAEAVAKATGRKLWIPGGVHPYEFAIGAQLYLSSTMVLEGDGGCVKSTKLVRMDGSFTDLLIGGEWDEGATHTIPNGIMPYNNGFPYTDTNIGHDISIRHIYLGGNGQNAGYAPSLGPGTGYRGSNMSMRCIDGITIHDVRSEGASNDCIHVARCRRIMITDCWVEKNFLVGNVIGGTRNGLTVAGTLGGLGFDRRDYMIIRNITGVETEDLAVAVQFVTPAGTSTPYAGTVIIDGIFTTKNATYGLGVEVFGSGENQPSRENIIITNVISEEDGTRTGEAYSSVLISHKSRAVIASNIIIRKARGTGLIFSGTESIQLSNIMVDEYNLGDFPNCKGIFGYQVAPDVPDVCQLVNIMVRGGAGRGGDTSAVAISGYNHIYGTNVHGDGTSFLTAAANAVINVSAKYIRFTQSSAINGACNGWFLGGYVDFSLIGCTAYDNGKGGGAAQRIGFNFGPGTNRTGRVSGCDSSDRQAIPTQTIGYLLGISATDAISITDSDAKGNITGAVVNLGMPNARVHSNGFVYVGQTQGLHIGGNGSYLSALRMGNYYLWVELATGKLRIKAGAPTSDSDGIVVGTQV